MKLQGTLLLTIMSLLERLCYYGVRSVLVLYALDKDGLNIDRNDAFEFYGILTMLLVILPIPFGLLTDKLLGQTKSIYLGHLRTSVYLLYTHTHTLRRFSETLRTLQSSESHYLSGLRGALPEAVHTSL